MDLKSSENVIRALGDFSTEIMQLMHGARALSEYDERELKETLSLIHELMARIGYTTS
jgi:hypothetical protein